MHTETCKEIKIGPKLLYCVKQIPFSKGSFYFMIYNF